MINLFLPWLELAAMADSRPRRRGKLAFRPRFSRRNRFLLIVAFALGWLCVAQPETTNAQAPASSVIARMPEPVRTFRSFSGQFIVPQYHPGAVSRTIALVTNKSLVVMEPTLLTVSCERIKQLLYRELGSSAPWQGKIFVVLYPAITENDAITITCEDLQEGWRYRVDLPDRIAAARFTRAMVQLLLLEMANRTASDRSAEIPNWLAEGLTRQLQATSEKEIILSSPHAAGRGIAIASSEVEAQMGHPLEAAHKVLCAHPPLTFEQLSWATPEQFAGPQAELFAASSQFFVEELLHLEGGQTCMQTFLAELPRHYNWQLAFLRAFHSHFQRPLDTEKWWALRVVHFTGRELEQTWPLQESWQKLNEAVRASVELRAAPNELPIAADVSLQTILREWDKPQQTQVIQERIRELKLVRQRVAPEVVTLADSYRMVLEKFLRERDKSSLLYLFRRQAAVKKAAEQAVRELDALDSQRLAMRPASRPLAAGGRK